MELDHHHQPKVSGPQYMVEQSINVLVGYQPEAPQWVLESKVETDMWGSPLYWQHDQGWVDFDQATTYDDKQLALEGTWIRI